MNTKAQCSGQDREDTPPPPIPPSPVTHTHTGWGDTDFPCVHCATWAHFRNNYNTSGTFFTLIILLHELGRNFIFTMFFSFL